MTDKEKMYDIVMQSWKAACAAEFKPLSDAEWEELIKKAESCLEKYKADPVFANVARKIFGGVFDYYESAGKVKK